MADFREFLKQELERDPEFRREWEADEPARKVAHAVIGARCRLGWTQAELAERMGTTQSAIARMEGGGARPNLETLEKLARALELSMYRLFYDGELPPKLPSSLRQKPGANLEWGASGKNRLYLSKLRRCLARIDERDRKLLMATAQKVAGYGRGRDRGGVTADVKA